MKIGEMPYNNEKKLTDSFDFGFTEKLIIERNKSVDSAVMVEIKKIAVEGGIETKFILNERNILNALKKQIAKKPIYWNNEMYICPNCHRAEYIKQRDGLDVYCGGCGQRIDWNI